jgi:hypothetical protein
MAKGQKEDQEEFKTTTICLFLIAFSLFFFLGMTLFISRLSVIIAFKLLVDIFLNVTMHVIYFLNKIYPKIYIC